MSCDRDHDIPVPELARVYQLVALAPMLALLGCATVEGRDNPFGAATSPWSPDDTGPCDVRSVPRNAFRGANATRYVVLGFRPASDQAEEAVVGRQAASTLFSHLREHLANVACEGATPAQRASLSRQIDVVRLSCIAGDDETAREVGLAMDADLVIWGESSAPLARARQAPLVVNDFTQIIHASEGGVATVGGSVQMTPPPPDQLIRMKESLEGSYRVHAALTVRDLPSIQGDNEYSPVSRAQTLLDLSGIVGGKPYDLIVFVAGLHFYQQREYSKALRFFRRVSRDLRSDRASASMIRWLIGDAELREGRVTDAIAHFREGAAFTPEGHRDWWRHQLSLLDALARAGQVAEANALAGDLALKVPTPDEDEETRSFALNALASSLSDLHRPAEALEKGRAAVEIRRALAGAKPSAFEPDLAAALNDLSTYLGDLGQRGEALQAVEESVALYQKLSGRRPEAFQADLAMALNNQSIQLAGTGKRAEALRAVQASVALYRRLAEERPEAFQQDLAWSLNSLSVRLGDLGQRKEALRAIDEAVGLYWQLARAKPGAFDDELAMSLSNRSIQLGALGKQREAVEAIDKAVALLRPLVQAKAGAFEPQLASALNDRSARLVELGREKEALEAITESAALFQQLANEKPAEFEAQRALAMNNLSLRLAAAGRTEDALKAIDRAVQAYRQLAERSPGQFDSNLAVSLGNRAVWLGGLGRRQEALEAIQGAVKIYRRLAQEKPADFEGALARSLLNLSVRLSDCQKNEEALAAVQESVKLLRGLKDVRPAAYGPYLVDALRKLSLRLLELGRRAESGAAKEEASTLSRQLSLRAPAPDTVCTPGSRVPCEPLASGTEPAPVNSSYVQTGRSQRGR